MIKSALAAAAALSLMLDPQAFAQQAPPAAPMAAPDATQPPATGQAPASAAPSPEGKGHIFFRPSRLTGAIYT